MCQIAVFEDRVQPMQPAVRAVVHHAPSHVVAFTGEGQAMVTLHFADLEAINQFALNLLSAVRAAQQPTKEPCLTTP